MLNDIINENNNLSVVLTDSQLRQLASMLASELRGEDDEKRRKERERLVTNEKACEMLGKDRGTLWRWAKEGYLPAIKVGRSVRFRLGDIQDILEGKR